MDRIATTLLAVVMIVPVVGCAGAGRPRPLGLLSRGGSNGFPDFKKGRTFNPTRYPQGNWRPAELAYEDVWFRSADGTRLHGWYVEHENPRAVVLYCHGNSGNLSHRADVLRRLHDEVDVSVFIFDYRGYGRSHGRPSEDGVLADARAARAWLARRTEVAQQDIVLLGHALGTGVAVDLAARDGAKALVLESAFTSVPDVGSSYFPRLPVRMFTRTEMNSLQKIRRYRGPLLQSHGNADTIVPYRLGARLYRAANQPKQFVTLSGHNHMDPLGPDYYRRLGSFLDGVEADPTAEPMLARQPADSPSDHAEPNRADGPSQPFRHVGTGR